MATPANCRSTTRPSTWSSPAWPCTTLPGLGAGRGARRDRARAQAGRPGRHPRLSQHRAVRGGAGSGRARRCAPLAAPPWHVSTGTCGDRNEGVDPTATYKHLFPGGSCCGCPARSWRTKAIHPLNAARSAPAKPRRRPHRPLRHRAAIRPIPMCALTLRSGTMTVRAGLATDLGTLRVRSACVHPTRSIWTVKATAGAARTDSRRWPAATN
jgi:hypothetical protein